MNALFFCCFALIYSFAPMTTRILPGGRFELMFRSLWNPDLSRAIANTPAPAPAGGSRSWYLSTRPSLSWWTTKMSLVPFTPTVLVSSGTICHRGSSSSLGSCETMAMEAKDSGTSGLGEAHVGSRSAGFGLNPAIFHPAWLNSLYNSAANPAASPLYGAYTISISPLALPFTRFLNALCRSRSALGSSFIASTRLFDRSSSILPFSATSFEICFANPNISNAKPMTRTHSNPKSHKLFFFSNSSRFSSHSFSLYPAGIKSSSLYENFRMQHNRTANVPATPINTIKIPTESSQFQLQSNVKDEQIEENIHYKMEASCLKATAILLAIFVIANGIIKRARK